MKKLIIVSILLFWVMYPPGTSHGEGEIRKPISTIENSKQEYEQTVQSFFSDFKKLQKKLDTLEIKIKHK